jgi:hypothetical protein
VADPVESPRPRRTEGDDSACRRLRLRLAEEAGGRQAAEHLVLALLGGNEVAIGIEQARGLWQAGEQRCL